VSYLSRDDGNAQAHAYPVVKIGTQYWMKENLCATAYSTGESITPLTELDGTPGYFHANGSDDYFYNGEALRADLAYGDWRIPSTDDWKRLFAYVDNKVELLAGGEWQVADGTTDEIASRDGATGFHALAVGQWAKGQQQSQKQITAYWALDGAVVAALIPHLAYNSDAVVFKTSTSSYSSAQKSFYKGVSVRLMKGGE
jgi:uncharacterized protein (TIGR02145 family)